jgi:hypothetical protein
MFNFHYFLPKKRQKNERFDIFDNRAARRGGATLWWRRDRGPNRRPPFAPTTSFRPSKSSKIIRSPTSREIRSVLFRRVRLRERFTVRLREHFTVHLREHFTVRLLEHFTVLFREHFTVRLRERFTVRLRERFPRPNLCPLPWLSETHICDH